MRRMVLALLAAVLAALVAMRAEQPGREAEGERDV